MGNDSISILRRKGIGCMEVNVYIHTGGDPTPILWPIPILIL